MCLLDGASPLLLLGVRPLVHGCQVLVRHIVREVDLESGTAEIMDDHVKEDLCILEIVLHLLVLLLEVLQSNLVALVDPSTVLLAQELPIHLLEVLKLLALQQIDVHRAVFNSTFDGSTK